MSNKLKILVVEDEEAISNFIATTLKANGYNVIMARTGKEALSMIPSHCPDVILLDLGLPDIDGIDILQQIREWSNIPVIVVSARTEEADKVKALDMGADDYIAKPFGTSELLARIRTALRHVAKGGTGNTVGDVFTLRGLTINFDKRQIIVDGKDVHLTQIEFKIVSLLAKSAGRVLTYDYHRTVGALCHQRQPDSSGKYGKHPPETGKKSCPTPVHLYRSWRWLPNG